MLFGSCLSKGALGTLGKACDRAFCLSVLLRRRACLVEVSDVLSLDWRKAVRLAVIELNRLGALFEHGLVYDFVMRPWHIASNCACLSHHCHFIGLAVVHETKSYVIEISLRLRTSMFLI